MDSAMSTSERMSPVDTTWLRMDRPENRMAIVGIMLLDGPLDITPVASALAERILRFRRFRQRIEIDPVGGAWWQSDEHFDIGHHIKRIRLPGDGGKAELERFVADTASQPFEQSHPLWQFHIVEDYEGGAAVVARIHHAIGDGMALIGVMLTLTDEHPAVPPRHRQHEKGFFGGFLGSMFSGLFDEGLKLSNHLLRQSLAIAANPAKALDLVRGGAGIASELAWLLMMPADTPTRFKGALSGDKRVAWTDPIALPEVKAVSRVLGCSVNDLLLAAVTGALHGYLREKGDATEGVEIRALVPINLRSLDDLADLGNRFGVVALELPVGMESPLERLFEVRHRMEKLKNSYEPVVTLGLLAALGYAPKLVQDQVFDLLLSRASAVMTNVPGPQYPLHIAGARMRQVMFWVPQAGNIGMGVSILSFDGQVQFGLITDAGLTPDPEAIIARFRPEFEKLLYYVLMEPWEAGAETAQSTPPEQPALPPAPRPGTRTGKRKRARA